VGKALLVGDPAFDAERVGERKPLGRDRPIEKGRYGQNGQPVGMRGIRFARLPGTRGRWKAIHILLGEEDSELYLGEQAMKAVCAAMRHPACCTWPHTVFSWPMKRRVEPLSSAQ